ncbi:TetR/AcrR family transcriptional regulator [Streptomyces sp. NPDC088921]|uniref:TetR/AcrR family transcriptional regulator n=1 Tax=unclassified Streptomyces TaxID=2593676 RepID=UPI00341D0D48
MRLTRSEAKAANRRALLDAARILVTQDGGSVSVDAIAEAADLTSGAIYSIFGSKNDLLVALITENMARIDEFLTPIDDPTLTVEQAIDAYLDAWLASYYADTVAQNTFALQVVLAAAEDEGLTRKLTSATTAEVSAIARLFVDRVLPGTDHRCTPEQARDIALAIQAVLSGFTLRESFTPDQTVDLVRRTCRAIAGIGTPA